MNLSVICLFFFNISYSQINSFVSFIQCKSVVRKTQVTGGPAVTLRHVNNSQLNN